MADLTWTYGESTLRRFESRIAKGDDCWEWQGKCQPNGYGYFSAGGGTQLTHRLAYALWRGTVPDRIYVCHECDNPPCCNPAHLFLGTPTDNQRDASRKGRLNVPHGRLGVEHHMTTLNDDDVREMRRRYAAGESQRALGERYGIWRGSVHRIVNRKTWQHI